MKERLLRIYRDIRERFPRLAALLRRIYFRKPVDSLREHVSGRENVIERKGAILTDVVIEVAGNNNRISIASDCVLNAFYLHISGDDHIVEIGPGCRAKGGTVWIEDAGSALRVGAGCTFEVANFSLAEGASITIGEDCMFAYEIDVRSSDAHAIIDDESGERINPAEDVVIGRHVWVGARSLLLKGVRIGDGCVIGAGSVVTKAFDERNAVIAGNPAKVVRSGVRWTRERDETS